MDDWVGEVEPMVGGPSKDDDVVVEVVSDIACKGGGVVSSPLKQVRECKGVFMGLTFDTVYVIMSLIKFYHQNSMRQSGVGYSGCSQSRCDGEDGAQTYIYCL